MQAYNSVMFENFCLEFNDFILKGKSLLYYTNLFAPKNMERMIK